TGLGSGIASIATGGNHTCAVTTIGALKCWGYNYYGQLGNGTDTDSLVPTGVAGFAGSDAPGVPSGLITSSSGSSVTLWWVAPTSGSAPDTYMIEAGSAPGLSDLARVSTGTAATTFSASGVAAGTYYLRVRAGNASGIGAPSNEAVLVVGGGDGCRVAPGSPRSLTATGSGSSVTLSWNAPSGGCAPDTYVIEAGSAPGLSDLANFSTGTAATAFSASAAAGTYYLRVRALNSWGIGAPSNEVALIVVGGP
ncbi:MAG: hypothetical protein NTY02_18455, partial [Acidobacteria bacterium]|nr:hypothetical protein [Acidobacteriota bacterium]